MRSQLPRESPRGCSTSESVRPNTWRKRLKSSASDSGRLRFTTECRSLRAPVLRDLPSY
jgi:hypothetical protein